MAAVMGGKDRMADGAICTYEQAHGRLILESRSVKSVRDKANTEASLISNSSAQPPITPRRLMVKHHHQCRDSRRYCIEGAATRQWFGLMLLWRTPLYAHCDMMTDGIAFMYVDLRLSFTSSTRCCQKSCL